MGKSSFAKFPTQIFFPGSGYERPKSDACVCHSFPDFAQHPGAVSALYWLGRALCMHCLQGQRDVCILTCVQFTFSKLGMQAGHEE